LATDCGSFCVAPEKKLAILSFKDGAAGGGGVAEAVEEAVGTVPVDAVVAGAPAPPRWHFLGALQRNKVRALAPWVVCWQSVDRPELGPVLGRHAPGATVLIEVNLAGEPQKSGCAPEVAAALRDTLSGHGLVVAGLMAVPPAHDDPRRWFVALRELGERLGVAELSMGMTDDYETAVEEGATIVRVGRALFGDRPT